MGVMAVMDATAGDVKVIWDPENEDEVAAVQQQFDELRAKGFLAYRVAERGRKGVQLREFDPNAESLILAPPLVGG